METSTARAIHDPAADFYIDALKKLQATGIPFLVGGAFAFSYYSRVPRDTKDIDIFVRPADVHHLLEVCAAAGYDAELVFSHWLAKVRSGDSFIDVIFSSGNGIAVVDDQWFEHATEQNVLGLTVLVAPAEESVWSKAFVMERERFDGADVAHIILAYGDRLDWRRLLDRFGPHWRVLLSHLVLYGFIFPSARSRVPAWVMHELLDRLAPEIDSPDAEDPVCYGTLLSWSQYLGDVFGGNFRDARIRPYGSLSAEEVARWTSADKK
jgi:hypothetical protein